MKLSVYDTDIINDLDEIVSNLNLPPTKAQLALAFCHLNIIIDEYRNSALLNSDGIENRIYIADKIRYVYHVLNVGKALLQNTDTASTEQAIALLKLLIQKVQEFNGDPDIADVAVSEKLRIIENACMKSVSTYEELYSDIDSLRTDYMNNIEHEDPHKKRTVAEQYTLLNISITEELLHVYQKLHVYPDK